MKRWIALIMAGLLVALAAGCEDDDDSIFIEDDAVPATPQGVFSVTGDGVVLVFWNGIYERDVREYVIYRSFSATTGYVAIGSVDAVSNPNLDLLIYEYHDGAAVNGTTYWYAVTAVDYAGQESELSAEDVYDTPRPDGQSAVYPNDLAPELAGFNLVTGSIVGWQSAAADIWADRVIDDVGGEPVIYPYLNAGNSLTDIQDMGYTVDFDVITYAPADGWSQLGYVEAVEGHTYVIWTDDDHYAKVRITSISPSGVISFQWAYQTSQTDLGRPELAPPARPSHDSGYPFTQKEAGLLK